MSIELPKKTPRDINISLQLFTKYHPNGQKEYEGYYEDVQQVTERYDPCAHPDESCEDAHPDQEHEECIRDNEESDEE